MRPERLRAAKRDWQHGRPGKDEKFIANKVLVDNSFFYNFQIFRISKPINPQY